jgi:hypothetical protein
VPRQLGQRRAAVQRVTSDRVTERGKLSSNLMPAGEMHAHAQQRKRAVRGALDDLGLDRATSVAWLALDPHLAPIGPQVRAG